MQRHEYEVLSAFDNDAFRRDANALGAKGWRMVSASVVPVPPTGSALGGGAGGGCAGYTSWVGIFERACSEDNRN